VAPAYEEAMIRELQKLALAIPPRTWPSSGTCAPRCLDIEGIFATPGDRFQRYVDAISRLSHTLPAGALLGYTSAMPTWGTSTCWSRTIWLFSVRMANAAFAESGRPVDFYHLTVPRDRDDDAYFQPLENLDVGEGRVFLGLLHHTDGPRRGPSAGSPRRSRTCTSFGVRPSVASDAATRADPRAAPTSP